MQGGGVVFTKSRVEGSLPQESLAPVFYNEGNC